MFVDLGAEKLLAAEKSDRKIAVEVKSFLGKSELDDLQKALGQYTMYRQVMTANGLDRELYLAVRRIVFNEVFEEDVGRLLMQNELLNVLVFDATTVEVVRWIP